MNVLCGGWEDVWSAKRLSTSCATEVAQERGDAMNNYREVGYALLRVTLGMIFLTTGIVKFMMGVGNFAAGMQQQFAGKLPMFFVTPFA